jgi:four helix bundle protein
VTNRGLQSGITVAAEDNMTPQELRDRTMALALAVFRLTRPLMREPSSRHVANQMFRAATSVAANYRSACLGRSPREFAAKLGVVREEADETAFWLEFSDQAGLAVGSAGVAILAEARELAAIFSAAYRTSKAKLAAQKVARDRKVSHNQ